MHRSILYAGYQYDAETGIYYLNARMYDPVIARFLQEDTYLGDTKDPLSLNRYSYCNNNPISYYDPTGHTPFPSNVGYFSHGRNRGVYNEYVEQIQKRLQKLGFLGYFSDATDGKFGPKTKQSVKDFQKANGLETDGCVGPITWSYLFPESGKTSTSTTSSKSNSNSGSTKKSTPTTTRPNQKANTTGKNSNTGGNTGATLDKNSFPGKFVYFLEGLLKNIGEKGQQLLSKFRQPGKIYLKPFESIIDMAAGWASFSAALKAAVTAFREIGTDFLKRALSETVGMVVSKVVELIAGPGLPMTKDNIIKHCLSMAFDTSDDESKSIVRLMSFGGIVCFTVDLVDYNIDYYIEYEAFYSPYY